MARPRINNTDNSAHLAKVEELDQSTASKRIVKMSGLLLATSYGEAVPDRFSLIRRGENGGEITEDITNVFYREGGYNLDDVERMQNAHGGQCVLGKVSITVEVSEVEG